MNVWTGLPEAMPEAEARVLLMDCGSSWVEPTDATKSWLEGTPRRNPVSMQSLPQPLETTHLLAVSMAWPILPFHTNGIIHYRWPLCLRSFTSCFVQDSIMLLHLPTCQSFVWPSHIPLHGQTTLGLSIHQFTDIYLGSGHFLIIMNICCYEHLWTRFCLSTCYQFS